MLRLHQRGGGSGRAADVAAYPSKLLGLAEGTVPGSIARGTLLGNRPRAEASVPLGARWISLDITELYRTWIDGGPFPSRGETVPVGTPPVVEVRPPHSGDDPGDSVRVFVPVRGPAATRPRLVVEADRDCGGG